MILTTLRTHDGHYLCAEPDGRVVADRTEAGAWETWAVEEVPGGVALRSAHVAYLCAEPDGSVIANRDSVGAWETWEPVWHNGGVAFRSHHGGFLVAEGGGGGAVQANRYYDTPGPWETFTSSASLIPAPPARLVRPIDGLARVIGRSFGDASGPRILHGYSDFAAIVKYHENRDKFLREADVAAQHQQYVRVLWRLNGWKWTPSGLTVDPIRDAWFDESLRGMLTAYHERGLRVNLSTGDMNNWDREQAEESFERVAQIAASVSSELVWLSAAANELYGTMQGGESDANIAFCEGCMRAWARHYPWSLRAISDAHGGAKADLTRMSRGNANVALIHDVRWETPDALRRAFNSVYENGPAAHTDPLDRPLVQDEPTGPNGSPPYNDYTRLVYQPIEDHDDLLAIYTMHVITGQASTYFSDPALVSREPIDSTWGFGEIPAFWRLMEIPENIGQGTLKPGHHDDAPLLVTDSGAERADSAVIGGYNLGVISGGNHWRVKAGKSGQATAYTAAGIVWEGRVSRGEVLPIAGPTPTVVRLVS